jgi:serine/threonine protein phosphatase 1
MFDDVPFESYGVVQADTIQQFREIVSSPHFNKPQNSIFIGLKLKQNEVGTDYICGDIHGCYAQLMVVLDHIKFDKSKDRLICCGDIFDRGSSELYPDNDYNMLLLLNEPWFFTVIGNHEHMLVSNQIRYSYNNGQDWFMPKLKDKTFIDDVRYFLNDSYSFGHRPTSPFLIPWTIELESKDGLIGVIHACVPDKWFDTHWGDPDILMFTSGEPDVLWDRVHIQHNSDDVPGVHLVFHGHTPLKKPLSKGNRRYIDTGFVYGNFGSKDVTVGSLTLYNVSTGTLNTIALDFSTNKVVDK